MSLEACFDAEAIHHSRSGDTADHKEAAKAFVEKRKPVFRGPEMAEYLRLRQICLVAPHLEPVISDIPIMGLNVCYRDGNVAKYGLENALLPVDTILLEVVAPTSRARPRGAFSTRPAAAAATWRSSAATIPTRAASTPTAWAYRQRDHARALSRRATAPARLPRRVHRVQSHHRQRRCAGPIRRRDRIGRRPSGKM